MLPSVVLPPRERLLERCLTIRNALRQGESADEQESSKHSCERQEAGKAVGRHEAPLGRVGSDDPTECPGGAQASARRYLRIEERELKAGGLN
jgi:hypothetical protein